MIVRNFPTHGKNLNNGMALKTKKNIHKWVKIDSVVQSKTMVRSYRKVKAQEGQVATPKR